MINIVIPMAGLGSRFSKAGYLKPKPFIDVNGIPMIQRVMANLDVSKCRFILIGREEHFEQEKTIVEEIKAVYPDTFFIGINKTTEGTAATVLFAKELIDDGNPLIIANSDQIIDINFLDFILDAKDRDVDGSILCFKDSKMDPKWSFAKVNNEGYVLEVKEKQPISDLATVGIYYFKRGKDFVSGAIQMIISNDRVNGEFYTCPVYNYLLEKRFKVGVYIMDFKKMHGIGTPEDLERYIKNIDK